MIKPLLAYRRSAQRRGSWSITVHLSWRYRVFDTGIWKSHLTCLHLALGICLVSSAFSCASSGLGEDDINRRGSYQDDDSASSLMPSPKMASEEALQGSGKSDDRDSSRIRSASGQEASGVDASGEISDIAAAIAQIAVPQGQEEPKAFAPVRGRTPATEERRKPIYLGKLGIEALFSQSESVGIKPALAPTAPGTMRFSARAKPGSVPITSGMGTYLVRPGDTLSLISMHIYGTMGRWMELAHLNRLGNGSIIYPKEVILYVP